MDFLGSNRKRLSRETPLDSLSGEERGETADKLWIGHLHDGVILLLRPEPFSFLFHIQIL